MMLYIKRSSKFAAPFLFLLTTSGCVSTSWVAETIVRPNVNKHYSKIASELAKPFYTQKIRLPVSGTIRAAINLAVVEPANYDMVYTISYRPNHASFHIHWRFPELETLYGNGLYDSVKRYSQITRKWVSTLKTSTPVGTVIMLPGFGMTKSSMMPWALFFAERGWRIILVNLRGQGMAKCSPKYLTWGVKDKGDLNRLAELLNKKGILVKPWLYFGISYGAGVALMAAPAKNSPDGIIAISPWSSAERVIPSFAKASNPFLSELISKKQWKNAEEIAGRRAGIDLSQATPENVVGYINSPVLYIGSKSDKVVSSEAIASMAKHTRKATLVLKENLSHLTITADIPGLCAPISKWLHKNFTLKGNPVNCDVSVTRRENGAIRAIINP